MTIHKQKSKENPVDCSATSFPSSFQREKQRDGTDPTPSVPASLLASGSMCNGAGGTHTLSAQRTNRALMSFLVLPNGWGMKSCCFTHQSIGQGPGAVQACLDGQLSNLSRASHTPCKAMMKPGTS